MNITRLFLLFAIVAIAGGTLGAYEKAPPGKVSYAVSIDNHDINAATVLASVNVTSDPAENINMNLNKEAILNEKTQTTRKTNVALRSEYDLRWCSSEGANYKIKNTSEHRDRWTKTNAPKLC